MAGAVAGMTYAGFEAAARAEGFDEVLVREWDPGLVLATHRHPFAVKAHVARGEFWLTEGDHVRHLVAGEGFELERDVPHAERYGASGATVWVARRHAG
jgi:quercetin dioxygenase-like cupin family protein